MNLRGTNTGHSDSSSDNDGAFRRWLGSKLKHQQDQAIFDLQSCRLPEIESDVLSVSSLILWNRNETGHDMAGLLGLHA